jgi:hypothetical protein
LASEKEKLVIMGSYGLAFRRVVFFLWLAFWLCETISHPSQLHAMTLWLNMQFLLWFSVDPRSDGEVAILHTAAWGSMHSLAVGYPVLLYFVPGGFSGLDSRLMREWCEAKAGPFDCMPNADLVRSFILHFLPVILLHIDLYMNYQILQQTHSRLRSFGTPLKVVMVIAPAVVGLLQKEVFFPGIWKTVYGVPEADLFTFDMFTNLVCIPMTFGSAYWLLSRFGSDEKSKTK